MTNTTEVKIRLIEELTLIAETESGHGIILNATPENGGKNLGPSLMELLLVGTAAFILLILL